MSRTGWKRVVCLGGSLVLLLTLSSCLWPGAGKPHAGKPHLCATPGPKQDTGCLNQGKPIGAWYDLHMIDAANGWASTYSAILHTTDGGQHWHDVTPWQSFSSWGHTATFLTADVAWVLRQAVPDQQLPARTFRTTDGGRTWQSASLPDALGNGGSTFSTASGVFATGGQAGWAAVRELLYPPSDPDNIQVSFVHFWRTQDGGQHWTRVLDALPLNNPRKVPPGGYLWVAFPTAQHGFMSEVQPQSLLATHDGGQTWQRQMLPAFDQTHIESGTVLQHAPTFVNPSDGILPITGMHANHDGQSVNVYEVTHDGGAHWHPTPPLVLSGTQPTDFITATDWTVLGDDGILYQTQDAGQTWSQTKVQSPFLRLVGVRFLSATEAWAIGDNDTHRGSFKGAESDLTVPVRSMDGGVTWTAVTPYTID